MLTPVFNLQQTEATLIIEIRAPFAKINESEIDVDEKQFTFYSKPYFLRLTFPSRICECPNQAVKYDSEKGWFTVIVSKEKTGEHFEGLDMLTKLLTTPGKTNAGSHIISVEGGDECDVDDKSSDEDEWYIEQEIADITSFSNEQGFEENGYGFALRRNGVFKELKEELCDIVDVYQAESKTRSERRNERIGKENTKFDDDHYLFDLFENDDLEEILSFNPEWRSPNFKACMTDEERDLLLQLPKREYILDSHVSHTTILSLLDILFAFCYDHRTTLGHNSVESSWTICKLSATLSWLEVFTSITDVVISCYRRSLCYPLYRHWKLSYLVWQDVAAILQTGDLMVVKCLLHIQSILAKSSEHKYIINDLYITDYCVWCQTLSTKRLLKIGELLEQKINISKVDVKLDIDVLEIAANTVIKEELTDENNAKNSVENIDSDDSDREEERASIDILRKQINSMTL